MGSVGDRTFLMLTRDILKATQEEVITTGLKCIAAVIVRVCRSQNRNRWIGIVQD